MQEELFGTIAQRKKYVSAADIEKALLVQKERDRVGSPHKLLGIIMLELGMLSSTQLLDILREMDKRHKQESHESSVLDTF